MPAQMTPLYKKMLKEDMQIDELDYKFLYGGLQKDASSF